VAGDLDYQFWVSLGGPYQVIQDFSPSKTVVWTPSSREGGFAIQVVVRNRSTGETLSLQSPITIASRVTGGVPVLTRTSNPLVALYSAPACPAGSSMYVAFSVGNSSNQTNTRPCNGKTSMNFYLAGMLASTTYSVRHAIVNGTNTTTGPLLTFTTGAVPSDISVPPLSIVTPPNGGTSLSEGVILLDNSGPIPRSLPAYAKAAYNLNGKPIWYYPGIRTAAQNGAYFMRPVDGGTIMLHMNDPSSAWVTNQLWREIDLAGNTVRQTNATRVNEQIAGNGFLGCTSFTHDAIRLPNGHTLILCTQEKMYPAGTQGATESVDIVGNGIVDLDQNLQLVWYWNSYDHLDINRKAILGELVTVPNGFMPLVLATVANDWLHANSLYYDTATGDLLMSMRDQDWIIKINYKNGTGDGSVIWSLGAGGSFTINSNDPYPWFSHQHDAEIETGGVLSLYDNGNTRVKQNPGVPLNSRGMALTLDEKNMVATPVLYADLGAYSYAAGSAQKLSNGDYYFNNGVLLLTGNQRYSQQLEVKPTPGTTAASINDLLKNATFSYRSYRLRSLYATK
jgi:hypothetical protein